MVKDEIETISGQLVQWLARRANNLKVVGPIPTLDTRRETSLRSINTGMSLVSFVQGLILEHQSLTIWWGRWVSIYALMTAPISKEMDLKKKKQARATQVPGMMFVLS